MTVIAIMAAALDQELQAHGIFSLRRADCEEIMEQVIERTVEVGKAAKQGDQPAK